MILTGKEIAKEVLAGRIVIDPFTPSQVQPNSYDFRLGDKLLVYDRPTVKVETRAGQPARNVPDPAWHLDAHRHRRGWLPLRRLERGRVGDGHRGQVSLTVVL